MSARVVHLTPGLKGQQFVRAAMAMAAGDGSSEDAQAFAVQRWGVGSLPARIAGVGGWEHVAIQKAAVGAGAAVSGNWAELLVDAESAAVEFFAAVAESSLIGRVPWRRVPLRTRLVGMSTGLAAAWVAEGAAKPVSKGTFAESELPSMKVSCLSIITREMLFSSDPAAESVIRNDMVRAISLALDTTLLNGAAGTPGTEPAAINNAVPAVTATTDGLDDLRRLIREFPGSLERAVLIGSPESFATMHDPMFLPGLGVRGGTAIGLPAIATSAAGNTVTLVDPDGVAMGIGAAMVRASRHADIEMDSAPVASSTVPTSSANNMVSMWQSNSYAMVSEVEANWTAARPSCAVLSSVLQS